MLPVANRSLLYRVDSYVKDSGSMRHCFTNGSRRPIHCLYTPAAVAILRHCSTHLIKVEFCRSPAVRRPAARLAFSERPAQSNLYPPDAITRATPSGRTAGHLLVGHARPPASRPITTARCPAGRSQAGLIHDTA